MENNIDHDFTETDDLVLNAINKFKNHPSIIMIKRKNNPCGSFSFSSVQYDDILKKTKNLDNAKASQESDIPTKILKSNCEFFAQYFCENINYCICHSILPSNLKLADVTLVYKKKKQSKNSKENYRPTSILSNVSKIYERCLYDQMQNYFNNTLSKYQCGFRKGYNAQHCLIALIEKWKQSVDNGGAFGTLMTDLSKAFNYLSHELLIAKLDAFGFDKMSLKLVHNYLSNRKQKVKTNDSYSSWIERLARLNIGTFVFQYFYMRYVFFLGVL